MKIDRVSSIGTTPARRSERSGSTKSGSFSKALSGSQALASGSVSGSGAPGPVDALLALQEVANEPNRRTQARKRGEELLDRLEELRMALLDGRLSLDMLERLGDLVTLHRGKVDDPRLDQVLDEIELRAAVELAKLGR